ncbi:YggS family pyridoxal phosphate-dependent enzyme [Candidatus Tachikawaea gelatinosa]|uniref:Pyridoxal phosphate homeostasis protein n=1 Tax=Candidatus Tachikawaea gelatinosa TaxID=1410383 RepID=A0A090AR50_9ENTR|nr:YggS family pyridoxal phosphate-dependent enzyme [Candidatus Tachikawaea gelatinosa]BAP58837.1 alanine racemase domain protein [Candidatus Tachikawaea gelatinosa]
MISIQKNLQTIRKTIINISKYYHRDYKKIKLVAVSKTKNIFDIQNAINNKQYLFGENYVQEAIKKIEIIKKTNKNCEWHFIGSIQKNKIKLIAKYFDWCHTVNKINTAELLNKHRSNISFSPINVLIQVNISEEKTKFGIKKEEIFYLAKAIKKLPQLCLRGLMAIPAKNENYEDQCLLYQTLNIYFLKLKKIYNTVDTLSLGMSKDINLAIKYGSTLLRIGTSIFGSRNN